jgi:hypothetical protein
MDVRCDHYVNSLLHAYRFGFRSTIVLMVSSMSDDDLRVILSSPMLRLSASFYEDLVLTAVEERKDLDTSDVEQWAHDNMRLSLLEKLGKVKEPMDVHYLALKQHMAEVEGLSKRVRVRHLLKYLSGHNLDLNCSSIRDRCTFTLANMAIELDDVSMLKQLVDAGIDLNCGEDVLLQASSGRHGSYVSNYRTFCFLLRHNARITSGNVGIIPINLHVLKAANKTSQLDRMSTILCRKFSLYCESWRKFILLNISVDTVVHGVPLIHWHGATDLYMQLKDRGVDVTALDETGRMAYEKLSIDRFEWLVRNHPDVLHLQNSSGEAVWYKFASKKFVNSYKRYVHVRVFEDFFPSLSGFTGRFSWDFVENLYPKTVNNRYALKRDMALHFLKHGMCLFDLLKVKLSDLALEQLLPIASFLTAFPSRDGSVVVRAAEDQDCPLRRHQLGRLWDFRVPYFHILKYLVPPSDDHA